MPIKTPIDRPPRLINFFHLTKDTCLASYFNALGNLRTRYLPVHISEQCRAPCTRVPPCNSHGLLLLNGINSVHLQATSHFQAVRHPAPASKPNLARRSPLPEVFSPFCSKSPNFTARSIFPRTRSSMYRDSTRTKQTSYVVPVIRLISPSYQELRYKRTALRFRLPTPLK